MGDASRYFYLKLREELLKLGAQASKVDQGVFYVYSNNFMIGIAILFVDDIIWAGTSEFKKLIDKFKEVFHVGTENSESFKYVGMHLKQQSDGSIIVDQIS